MAKAQAVNQQTGEITVVRGSRSQFALPKNSTVTPIETVAGKNPPASNLRDHPELNGMDVVIMANRFQDSTLGGKKGTYAIMACFVSAPGVEPKEEDFRILMTGSENVQGRLADAELAAGDGSPYPLRGRLRLSPGGRAWFLD